MSHQEKQENPGFLKRALILIRPHQDVRLASPKQLITSRLRRKNKNVKL